MNYLQGDEEKCAIYSLASALLFIGDNKMHNFISKMEPKVNHHEKSNSYQKYNKAFTYIVEAMTYKSVMGNPEGITKYTSVYYKKLKTRFCMAIEEHVN